jgi:S-adenosylmethionine decarboxylase
MAQALILGNNSEFSRRTSCFRSTARVNRATNRRVEKDSMDGIHLLGEWYGCTADMPEMTHADAMRKLCLQVAQESGMTVVGDSFFQFSPAGVTGTVLLAESHLAIHTWPEHGFVTIDVYVCNYTTDNTGKAERLFASMEDALRPQEARFHSIHRGGRDA